jgi:hypothetical protein
MDVSMKGLKSPLKTRDEYNFGIHFNIYLCKFMPFCIHHNQLRKK